MRAIVTGGAGFIGSHLVDRLLKDGHEVVCVDDLSTGSIENVRRHVRNKRFTFRQTDIANGNIGSGDRIYNLACPASPKHYQADPTKTLRTCVAGAWNVLDLARRTGARALQASTSEVYGDPEVHPQQEDYWGRVNSNGVRACYDEGKRAAETLFCDYKRQYGTDIRIARVFNTYGPRMQMDDGRAVPAFIMQVLSGVPITLHGGDQTRSFCYVDDTVEGMIALMESDETRPVNIGNPNEITIRELVNRIRGLTGSECPVHLHKRPEDDPERRCPDIRRAMSLGWEPKIALDEGLRRTINYFAPKVDNSATAA
ncbi:MAG: UDP-glucuronic acid decarboxylase family protein [Geminicoccaceae bacterium]